MGGVIEVARLLLVLFSKDGSKKDDEEVGILLGEDDDPVAEVHGSGSVDADVSEGGARAWGWGRGAGKGRRDSSTRDESASPLAVSTVVTADKVSPGTGEDGFGANCGGGRRAERGAATGCWILFFSSSSLSSGISKP